MGELICLNCMWVCDERVNPENGERYYICGNDESVNYHATVKDRDSCEGFSDYGVL